MASRARFLAPITLAVLSAVAALSLGRVVDSSRFVAPVLAAALLPHAIGAWCRWRKWPGVVVILLTALGLALFTAYALAPGTASLGIIPGSETWHVLHQHLDAGWHLLRTAPAPAPASDGAILLAVIAVWCMAGIADWLAFRRQATLGAVAPALVFFVWTSALGTSEDRLLVTAAFCLAAGAFLLAQNVAVLDRGRSWLVSHQTTRAHWLLPASALGITAVVVALVVAPALPGAGSDPLLEFAKADHHRSAGHSYQPTLPPFVDIGAKLDSVQNSQLFTVHSSVPDYWRIAALDEYSSEGGGQWTLSATGGANVHVGLPSSAPAHTLSQEFTIGPLGERWLPAAYRPVAIDLPDTLVVTSSSTLVADASSVRDLHYTVASELPVLAGTVTAAQKQATAARVPAALERYTALPTDDDMKLIAAEAKNIVTAAGATTPYAKAEALRDYFRGPDFRYDTAVDTVDSGSAIVAFLRDKRGFCVQFASAYAVMARSLGIPARVAVGFTPGQLVGKDTYSVTSHDAHAWPEIYLAGLGWTHLFDPTPGASGATAGGSDLPNEPPIAGAVTQPPTPTTTTQPAPAPTTVGGAPATAGPAAPAVASPSVSASTPHHGPGAWLLIPVILALLALVVGAYVALVLAAKSRRRARRRDAPDPAAAVTGAWEEALDRLREADVTPNPALTPLEVARAAPTDTTPSTEQPLRRLARAYTAVRYGDVVTDRADADDAWNSVDELERALDEDLSWRERWRRRLDPGTRARTRASRAPRARQRR